MAEPIIYRKDAVFAVTRGVPLNYVPRRAADEAFVANLTREKHIILHGSSKQGKTTLRKVCLKDDDYIVVQCQGDWSVAQLQSSMLKEAGFEVTQGRTVTVTGARKMNVALKAQFIEASAGRESATAEAIQSTTLELDVSDVNDIIRALKSVNFSRFIVLEDFHYLPVDTQQIFATGLKAYHERSNLSFIIVGVWLERNRLVVYNGDLSGRVVSINVDSWNHADLTKVIEKGETLLNIEFDVTWKAELLEAARESVYIVQEACNKALERVSIYQTQPQKTGVKTDASARVLVQEIVDADAARYTGSLQRFADGFKKSELQMYRWILLAVLGSAISELESGLRYNDIYGVIERSRPPSSMRQSDLTLALQKIGDLQVFRGIKPVIFDYDPSNSRLSIVDRGFLIWLDNTDRAEMKKALGLPY